MPRFSLWHSANTRSLRALWAFKEMGLRRGVDYNLEVLSFPPRQHHPTFLQRNPLGTVPWFEHREAWDNEPRAAMSECASLREAGCFDLCVASPCLLPAACCLTPCALADPYLAGLSLASAGRVPFPCMLPSS